MVRHCQILCYVMLGLVPGIHPSNIAAGGRFGHVDGRDKPGHDGSKLVARRFRVGDWEKIPSRGSIKAAALMRGPICEFADL